MNNYEEIEKQQLVDWVELCHDLLDESGVPTKEGLGTLSVYGRLCRYKKEMDEQAAALRAERDEAVQALEKIAAGTGVYGQQAREYKEIAQAALERIGRKQND